jgi:hypothetical protein
MKKRKIHPAILAFLLTVTIFSVYSISKIFNERKSFEANAATHDFQQMDEMYGTLLFNAIVYRAICSQHEVAAANEGVNQIIQEMYERGYTRDKIRMIEGPARSRAMKFVFEHNK